MTESPTPRVAIIIRTKDRPALLGRALSSVTSQTFGDWEAVIVNDGGDPQAVTRVITAAGNDPRIRVLEHEVSLGRWPSANAGVEATTAPYLVLHDDDDRWDPDFLAEMSAFLDENPGEWGVISRAEVILEKYEGEDLVETGRYELEDHNPEVLLTDLLDFNRFVPIQFLYRRTLHDRIGAYDASKPAAADWMFNLQVLALQPIRYVSSRVLAYWHQRPNIAGTLGNSVFAAPVDHTVADRRHRDEALRAYVQANGTGVPLYLAYTLGQRGRTAAEAEQRRHEDLQSQLAAIQQSLIALEGRLSDVHRSLDQTIDARIRAWVRTRRARLRRKPA